MTKKKVAIVTGSNRGVGFGIVKGLCKKFPGDVYLTARDKRKGLQAVIRVKKAGCKPKFHLLDITSSESIEKLKHHIAREYGGIDVLVNNAGIAYKVAAIEPFGFQAAETIRVNYFGTLTLCTMLFSLLRPHARIVNLSSSAGLLPRIPGAELRQNFSSPNLTIPELNNLMKSFVEDANTDNYTRKGWPNNAYAVSKVGIAALTFIQQRQFLQDKHRPDIVVNVVHPGHVKTDLTSHKGQLTIDQGAEAPIYCALLPQNSTSPKGNFVWYTKQIVDWFHEPVH